LLKYQKIYNHRCSFKIFA